MSEKNNNLLGDLMWDAFVAITEPVQTSNKSDAIFYLVIAMIVMTVCIAPFLLH